jgi:hyperosmotically inducible protein
VEGEVERSLDAAGLRDVTADQDQGVVTLSGEVASEEEKARAEEIAKSAATGQIVANEIAVRPPGMEGEARGMQSALDDGIEQNFKAKLIANKLNEGVDYDSQEGVLTLTGEVETAAKRQQLEQLAAAVPNVKQVVNKVEVEGGSAAANQPARDRAPATSSR